MATVPPKVYSARLRAVAAGRASGGNGLFLQFTQQFYGRLDLQLPATGFKWAGRWFVMTFFAPNRQAAFRGQRPGRISKK